MICPLIRWCWTSCSSPARWALAIALCSNAVFAEPVELSKESLAESAGQHGVIILEVNWGRQWGCAGLDNAQLQALTFSQWPDGPSLELKTPSRLFVDNRYQGYGFIIEPGEYFLIDFDVKVAQSVREVGHLLGESSLVVDGQPIGGSFSVGAGEFVYIGHFSLDCTQEPIPWRYYVDGAEDFAGWVRGVRDYFPFLGDVDIAYRPFETELHGGPVPVPSD